MTVRVQGRVALRRAGTPRLITVLMPTCNGAPHLAAQLASLAAQTRLPGQLILSDDRSRDATAAIVTNFARLAPFPVRVLQGPGRGVVANVMSLLASAPAGPLALADQDDVWLPDRLERGAAALAGLSEDQPAIAAAARIVTDDRLAPIRVRGYPNFADFAPSLVQNPAGGNTILMNGAAVALARAAARDADDLPPFHDWWLCQLVLGAGGIVVLDPRPSVLYRQHGDNLLGAGTGLCGQIGRARRLFDGTYGRWLRANARVLMASRHRLTERNRAIVEQFAADLAQNRFHPGRNGICREQGLGDLALRLAARLGCV